MPFDIVGFGEASPGANGKLAALLLDTLYEASGDNIKIKPQAPYLLGLWNYGEATLGKTKLQQASRPQDLEFTKGTLLSSDDPLKACTDMRARPLHLTPKENLNCEVVNAGDEDGISFLMLGSGKITQAMLEQGNPTHRITGYADTTLTAFTWGALTMTWNQTLPEGTYAVLGMRYAYFTASPAPAMPSAARLMFKESHAAGWRPGVVGQEASAAHLELQESTLNPFIIWPKMANIKFHSDNMPGVEAVSAEATTDEDIELLLEKIG